MMQRLAFQREVLTGGAGRKRPKQKNSHLIEAKRFNVLSFQNLLS